MARSTKRPEYPGYRAESCNGCGLCCLTVPCAVSVQFGLWQGGKCRALSFEAGRYWCDVIRNPKRVSIQLAKIPKAVRIDAIGGDFGCDHRAAYSEAEAVALLRTRNLADDVFNNAGDTYPRSCVWHDLERGKVWVITAERPAHWIIQECLGGVPYGPEEEYLGWKDQADPAE